MHKKISLIFPNKIGISEQISIENSSELTHQSLKKEASEKFAIPEEKILLKVQRDGFLVRIILIFEGLKEKQKKDQSYRAIPFELL